MGFHEDHRNTVADRWGKKFRESDMSPEQFSKEMKEIMKKYGWSATDIKKMVARAIGKDDAE